MMRNYKISKTNFKSNGNPMDNPISKKQKTKHRSNWNKYAERSTKYFFDKVKPRTHTVRIVGVIDETIVIVYL